MGKRYRCPPLPLKGRINNYRPEAAFVAVWTASIVLVLAVVAASLFGLAWGERVMSLQQLKQLQTYYVADAGVEYALSRCREDREWINGLPRVFNHNFAEGTVTVTAEKEEVDGEDIAVRVESQAVYQEYKRTVVARVLIRREGAIKVIDWHEKYNVFPKAGGR